MQPQQVLDIPTHQRKQDIDLKSQLIMVLEEVKKVINNSLKVIQDNSRKQVEALKEKTQKSTKQVKELNKATQNLKMEIATIKKTDNTGDRKSRKQIRSHRCKHHQQNTRDQSEHLRVRRYHKKH